MVNFHYFLTLLTNDQLINGENVMKTMGSCRLMQLQAPKNLKHFKAAAAACN